MLLKELLLTEIDDSETGLKYTVMDLNTYKTFFILDRMKDRPNYRFILNIFMDNAIMPYKHDVKIFQRLIEKNPLYFNAVWLHDVDDQIPLYNSVEDIVIIPNVEARGFARCNEQLRHISNCMGNLKGRY